MVSEEKSDILILVPLGKVVFPSGFFQDFIFVFDFLQCEYNMLRCTCLPLCVSWIVGVVFVINFWKFLSRVYSKYLSCFSFSSDSPIIYMLHLFLWLLTLRNWWGPGGKTNENVGAFLRLGPQEALSLNLVHTQFSASSHLPCSCYLFLDSLAASDPGKLILWPWSSLAQVIHSWTFLLDTEFQVGRFSFSSFSILAMLFHCILAM